ncbi:MAG: Glu-tRNA(Gln) amidotransferase GatDE subunit D, partial [Candidatus Aminicenantes bacterium]|nr:Glu-tRNA(Gln) amidotransferase GatDE subunit D [Candidatus Aminicenantes bacterium]
MDDLFKGYKGETLKLLKKFNVRVWSEVDIESSRGKFSGIILPRSENDDETHLVIKLITGYNIGLETGTIENITEKGFKEANYKIPEKEFPYSEGKPNLKLFGTGGTIASRL